MEKGGIKLHMSRPVIHLKKMSQGMSFSLSNNLFEYGENENYNHNTLKHFYNKNFKVHIVAL